MALVTKFSETTKENQKPHDSVDCYVSQFVAADGKRYVQLDTHGRSDRQMPGKISQTLQFDEASGASLRDCLNWRFLDRVECES